MKLNWPDDYQQRIETIIGAKFNGSHVDFLGFETFKSISESKRALDHIRIIRKQLHQLKMELNNKIKGIRSQHIPIRNRKEGLLQLITRSSNIYSDVLVRKYQNVALTVDSLIDKCEYQKNNIEIWMEGQNLKPSDNSYQRQSIPNEVQLFVWKRDGGKCVKCGRQENLEYDHIIPVSRCGSNTARNIQLLCESCNRNKSNSMGK